MPQVIIPALVAGGAAGVPALITGTLASGAGAFGITFGTSLLIGGINSALYKKPKADFPLLLASGGQNITTREAAPPRQVATDVSDVVGGDGDMQVHKRLQQRRPCLLKDLEKTSTAGGLEGRFVAVHGVIFAKVHLHADVLHWIRSRNPFSTAGMKLPGIEPPTIESIQRKLLPS